MIYIPTHLADVGSCCVLLCAVTSILGCSNRPKNVATKVTGTITLAGQPLPDAAITFTPVNGSPSSGGTDAEGKYNLVWGNIRGRVIEGAQIGEHTVLITTGRLGDPNAKPPKADVPEKVPYKYRQEGGYPMATVKRGTNTINFDLEAGPVDAPQPKGKTKTKGKLK